MNILSDVEKIKQEIKEVVVLSEYYDELKDTPTDDSKKTKEKMKYVREEILKKTYLVKRLLERLELSEKPDLKSSSFSNSMQQKTKVHQAKK